MKAEFTPRLYPRRGAEPKEGHVYASKSGQPCYKVVIAVVDRNGSRPWNNVVMLHVASTGDIVGCSRNPEAYIRNHMDLIGLVKGKLPSFKIEWLKAGDGK